MNTNWAVSVIKFVRMGQVEEAVIDWTRWSPVLEREEDEASSIRLDILSLRSYVNHVRGECFNEELKSKVEDLWTIGCNVLRQFKYGGRCIEMMGMLAYLNSAPLDFDVFWSEENRNLILMLKDAGFLMEIQSPTTTSISTEFPALMDEIRQTNFENGAKLLEKIIYILFGHGWRRRWGEVDEVMTSIWQHALTYGMRFIREYNDLWTDYLNALLEDDSRRLMVSEEEILVRALEIYDVEYGNTDSMSMELRFIQLRLFLREENFEMFLNQSRHYRSVLETIVMTTKDPWKYLGSVTPVRRHSTDRKSRKFDKEHQISELIYKKALQMNDVTSKTKHFEEAFAYCILGYDIWRSSIPDSDGDGGVFFGCGLKCLKELGRTEQMVGFVREIRGILMGHRFFVGKSWFPDVVLQFEGVGREMILNELSIYLNHIFNMRFREDEYLLKCLLKCERDLKNWNRILVIMKEKRAYWAEYISLAEVTRMVQLEGLMLDSVKNCRNDEVRELVNESLEFTKQIVEYLLNDGVYGEKYLVYTSNNSEYKDDPLVLLIKTCLLTNRHEWLLSYRLEYEKLLEDKYGERMGPITNGMLLFGEWFGSLLKNQVNTGKKFTELLQGVKTRTIIRMLIISNHPTEKKSWMQGYADLICKNCDSYLDGD